MPSIDDEDLRTAISADRYERLELIGTGSFGDVYRGYVHPYVSNGILNFLAEALDQLIAAPVWPKPK